MLRRIRVRAKVVLMRPHEGGYSVGLTLGRAISTAEISSLPSTLKEATKCNGEVTGLAIGRWRLAVLRAIYLLLVQLR